MLGSTVEDIGGLMAVEYEKKRTGQIRRNRETQTRVRQVNSRAQKINQLTVTFRADAFSFEPIQSSASNVSTVSTMSNL
jgi:hypothetical protein